MKRKWTAKLIAVLLSVCLLFGGSLSAAAAFNMSDLIGILGGNGGNVNLSEYFASWLNGMIQDDDDSVIDKFVEHLKNEFNGVTDDEPSDDPAEDSVTLREGEAENIAELFNISVNELKKGQPAFLKTQTATMDQQIASSLQGGLGPVTGLVESLIGTKDIFAGVIDGTNQSGEVREKYPAGNDIKQNLPVSGKDYVACLTADDIKDYTITIYRSGAYKMHIDLIDVEGNAASSGLSHVFNTVDKEYATLELGTTSFNIQIKLKYVHNYVECEVNKKGEVERYTMGMGITFLFQQSDGSYSSEMPFLGVDFEEEGIIYNITTEYTGFKNGFRQMGDANSDGKVNSTDARSILRMAAGLETCAEADLPYCDVIQDEKITPADAREVLRAAAGLTKLISVEEALGYKPYERDESVQKHVEDLLVLIMAYQTAKDEEEQKKLQESYEEKYQNGGTQEEETTGKINTTTDKVNEIIDIGGQIIGGIFGKK